jgi:hypothetical protein
LRNSSTRRKAGFFMAIGRPRTSRRAC